MPSLRRCAVLSVLALLGRAAGAQISCSASCTNMSVTAELSINSVSQIALSSPQTTLSAPRAADFGTASAPGYTATTGPALTVRANASVRVVVSAGTANPLYWSYTGPATTPPNKPIGDLLWAAGSAGAPTTAFVALTGGRSTANLLSTTATAGATLNGGTPQVFYRALWRWTRDRPGTYTLPVVFTLVSP